MRATILCVGRLDREYQGVWKHYESLLRPYAALEVLEVSECPLALGEVQARAKEGSALLGLFRKGAFSVAVDPRGREFTSEAWSEFLATKKVEGQSHFQFILGGASGLDPRVIERDSGELVAVGADLSPSDGALRRRRAAVSRHQDRARRALPPLRAG